MKVVGRIGWLAVAGLDAAALVCLRPHWADLASDLAAPHRWVARVGADRAAITLGCAVLWCVALWLAFGCIAVLAAAVPGRVGRGGRYVARQMLPEAMLRAVAGAAGLSVLIAPIAADAGTISNHASVGASALGGRLSHPAPNWPTDAGQQPRIRVGWPTDDPRGHRAHVPTPALPSSATPSSGRSVPGVPPPSRSAPGRSAPASRSVPGPAVDVKPVGARSIGTQPVEAKADGVHAVTTYERTSERVPRSATSRQAWRRAHGQQRRGAGQAW